MILGLLAMPPVCPIFGLAVGGILGLIFGATGFLVGFLLAFAAIPTGLITGIIALVRSNRRSDQYGGKAFAITGIVCSSIGLAVIPVIAAIAVPNLQASRRAANEGSAIATINKFADAEHAFARDMQVKRYSDLSGLVTAGLIDPDLEKGEKSGYRFRVVANIAGGCEIYAMPMSASYGDRSFYLSIEDGKIRSAVKDGMPANKNDTPIYDDDDDARPTRGVRETSL
jgi:hypothetical protein